MKTYRTILADPPWPISVTGKRKGKHVAPGSLPYKTMTIEDIASLPVGDFAETGAHCWIWVVNQYLKEGVEIMRSWGFRYHNMITWAKPSGMGNYFINRTEHILFGYKEKCHWNQARYVPNFYQWKGRISGTHSRKPEESYQLIESISEPSRLELFARPFSHDILKRPDWDVWGNEVISDIEMKGGA